MIFTTLFDSFYLDKALVMYESLNKECDDFKLYIFAFDDKSYEVLLSLDLNNTVIIHRDELEKEYPELLKLKNERSKAEFCWTCTPATIKYVIDKCKESNCTYIDADLFFFDNPNILLEEIKSANASVAITPHRFTNSLRDKRLLKRSGKYCVEFNYFDNSKKSMEVLDWWKDRCFEWCFHLYEPERMGDQKYLEKFPILFDCVHDIENLGAGVAPWNLGQYELSNGAISYSNTKHNNKSNVVLIEKRSGKKFGIIFYHFQNIRYITENRINACSGTNSKATKDAIYIDYLLKLKAMREKLAEYGVSFGVKKIYSSNKLIAFLQGTVLRFKIKSLSDIYDLDKLSK